MEILSRITLGRVFYPRQMWNIPINQMREESDMLELKRKGLW
jgi:hypothetical protein